MNEWGFIPLFRAVGICLLGWVDWRLAAAYVLLSIADFANNKRMEEKE